MAGGLLHLRHRLIRMGRIGDEPAVRAVGEQVELIEDGQANQHIIAEHECFFQRIAAEYVEDDRLGDADCILAAIGVFGDAFAAFQHAEFFHDVNGNDRPHGPGIHEAEAEAAVTSSPAGTGRVRHFGEPVRVSGRGWASNRDGEGEFHPDRMGVVAEQLPRRIVQRRGFEPGEGFLRQAGLLGHLRER